MNTRNRLPLNNIDQCLQQAQVVSQRLQNPSLKGGDLCQAFGCFAGDTTIGLLAYAIWRGRAELISSIGSEWKK